MGDQRPRTEPLLTPYSAPGIPGLRFRIYELQKACEDATGISRGTMIQRDRNRIRVWTRHIFFYLAGYYTPWIGVVWLGKYCGDMSHATVVHGRNNARDLIEVDPEFKEYVRKAKKNFVERKEQEQ